MPVSVMMMWKCIYLYKKWCFFLYEVDRGDFMCFLNNFFFFFFICHFTRNIYVQLNTLSFHSNRLLVMVHIFSLFGVSWACVLIGSCRWYEDCLACQHFGFPFIIIIILVGVLFVYFLWTRIAPLFLKTLIAIYA